MSALEAQVSQLLAEKKSAKDEIPWWQQMFGAFQNDEVFDSAMRLGEEYRHSQPTAAEEIEALERQAFMYLYLMDSDHVSLIDRAEASTMDIKIAETAFANNATLDNAQHR